MEGSGTFDDPPGALDGQPLSDIATAKERLNLLVESANFKVDTSVSPLRYFNSAKQLFETGKYEALHENNQKGYMLIMRFLELYITRLPRHPKYNLVGDDKKREVNKILKEALKLGEELKVKVLRELEDEREQEMARQAYLKQKYAAFAQPKIDGVVQQIANFNNALPSAPHYTDLRVSWPQQNSQLENYDGGTVDWSAPPPPYPGTHPSFDRSLKPSALVAPPRSSKLNNERRGPPPSPAGILRAVRIPADLVEQFTQAARENTEKKNIETCGNLWGRREEGSYVVTHLLIPKQKGTDSYCEDLDELSEAATYAISRDLIQLGWIHTHPTQSAFLSSVDLHMQWGYQMMLPEAIAIVVAPAYNDVAFFRLDDFGMQYISLCEHGTNFHKHDTSNPLFERVEDVAIDQRLSLHLEDFRFR